MPPILTAVSSSFRRGPGDNYEIDESCLIIHLIGVGIICLKNSLLRQSVPAGRWIILFQAAYDVKQRLRVMLKKRNASIPARI